MLTCWGLRGPVSPCCPAGPVLRVLRSGLTPRSCCARSLIGLAGFLLVAGSSHRSPVDISKIPRRVTSRKSGVPDRRQRTSRVDPRPVGAPGSRAGAMDAGPAPTTHVGPKVKRRERSRSRACRRGNADTEYPNPAHPAGRLVVTVALSMLHSTHRCIETFPGSHAHGERPRSRRSGPLPTPRPHWCDRGNVVPRPREKG